MFTLQFSFHIYYVLISCFVLFLTCSCLYVLLVISEWNWFLKVSLFVTKVTFVASENMILIWHLHFFTLLVGFSVDSILFSNEIYC